MMPTAQKTLVIEGTLPGTPALQNQTLQVEANGHRIGESKVPQGDFQLTFDVPSHLQGETLRLKIKASRSMVPARFPQPGDRRRLAYLLKNVHWARPEAVQDEPAESAYHAAQAGI
jgi:hypothetical protein